MAIERFWRNLRFAKRELETADRVLVPARASSQEFSLDLWLIPQTVEGFDPDDFPLLSDEKRQSLAEAVQRFRDVATRANNEARPATDEELSEAKFAFREIVELIELEKYEDEKSYRIAKVLERVLPVLKQGFRSRGRVFEVVDVRHRIEIDSDGDEALWIWVIVPDRQAESPSFFDECEEFRRGLEHLLRSYGIDYWPHIRFWTETEQAAEVGD
ncbi:hypothetical protein AB1L88_26495 [Tautonia sp. JC769]|uniref:hypothetical protein n=1 Tax=Tautonia sp. JC769 TaxID=3232135 RepID=UPI003458A67B